MLPGKSRLAKGLACAAGAARAAWSLWRRPGPPPQVEPVPEAEQAPARIELQQVEDMAQALREGLHTINGFSELLAQGGGTERDARAACQFIRDNSEELSRAVADLQDLLRYEQGLLRIVEQQVDAAELVEAALGLCRRSAEAGDLVIVAHLPEGVELLCDSHRIRNAVASMVLWAAGKAPAGSLIRIGLLSLPGEAVAVRVAGTERSGPGEPAAPGAASWGLRSLALPIASRVALLHSGELRTECGQGAGTSACLILPPHRVVWPERAGSCESRAA